MQNINDFKIILQKFISQFKDAHTNVVTENLYNSKNNFPIKLKWIKEKLYLSIISDEYPKEFIGKEIIGFEDRSLNENYKSCSSFISGENKIWKRERLKNI